MAEGLEEQGARGWREREVPGGGVGQLLARPARVIVSLIEPPLIHPLSKRDVQLVLSVLPLQSTSGLRSVSLLGDRPQHDGMPVFASYRQHGFIRLHAVSSLPWQIPSLPVEAAAELRLYGAEVDARPDGAVVRWLGESLRLFYTVGVLLPSVARHRRERQGGHETDSVIRALGDGQGGWWATEAALRQWGDFLRRSGG